MKMILTGMCFVVLLCQSLLADVLPAPTGKVVLTISGEIKNKTSAEGVQLDMEMLKSLPQTEFTTSTIWQDDKVTFTGVSIKTLLDYVAFDGSKVEAIALNDYKIEIPVSDIEEGAPIVAYLMNGAEMSARGKGPLWVVYPYDVDDKYQTEVIYARSIWQLDRMVSVK